MKNALVHSLLVAVVVLGMANRSVGKETEKDSDKSKTTNVASQVQQAIGKSKPHKPSSEQPLVWHDSYSKAWQQATKEEKQLLVFFQARNPSHLLNVVEQEFQQNKAIRRQLQGYVLVKLSLDARIKVSGESLTLIRHGSMAEMHGHEGLAIIDLQHKSEPYYGHVVSAFPFMTGKYYRFRKEYLPVILDLPPGTITQRTMVWAVRIHPENPKSTRGNQSTILASHARTHSQHQANIGVQGHHNWEGRFHLLRRLFGGRRTPVEVVAESWPSQTMIDSCIDCVASWRHSSGHWNAVKSYHPEYGYDIKRGSNGIWYGTGLFAE